MAEHAMISEMYVKAYKKFVKILKYMESYVQMKEIERMIEK